MTLRDIQTLYDYNYWAHHRILDVVALLTHEQFTKNLASSHGGLHGTMFHAMGAEEIWLKRWKGVSPVSFGRAEDFPDFQALRSHWESVEREMMAFVRDLKSDKDVERIITYKDLKGNEYAQPLHQLMQHLVNHSSYHRGQVVAMLRQVGAKPVGTDMVAFFREKK